jgi:hypothetical protein
MIDPVVEGRRNTKNTVIAISVGVVVFGIVTATADVPVYTALICALFIGGITWGVMQDF